MSFAPAVPPLPQGFSANTKSSTPRYSKPPIPPLPPNFNPREESQLAAPMPERAMPSLPADITRTLDDSLYSPPSSRTTSIHPVGPGGPPHDYRRPSPAPSAPGYGYGYGPPVPQQAYAPGPGQLYASNAHQSPPPGTGYPGGFARPPSTFAPPPRMGPSPAPSGYGTGGPGGFAPTQPMSTQSYPNPGAQYNLPQAMNAMSLTPASAAPYSQPPQPQAYPPAQQAYSSPHQSPSPHPRTSPSLSQGPPSLTAPLPTAATLAAAQRTLPPLAHPPHAGPSAAEHVGWIRDVVHCVERTITQQQQAAVVPDGQQGEVVAAVVLHAPLPSLLHSAISTLLTLLSSAPVSSSSPPGSVEPPITEALYIKGILYASDPFLPSLASPHPNASSRHAATHSPLHAGSNFEGLEHSPRLAFQAFSTAARLGYLLAWFKIGRDYELVGDIPRARDCFERGAGVGAGASKGEVGCLYRLGMAHLLGQLSFAASPPTAIPLLHRAAILANPETPQPAYVYGLILLSEFDRARVAEGLLSSLGLIPRGSSPLLEARRHIERAAFLGFAPAQYKLGHAYEYAIAPFPFDPLLSVQYYSLASQQGEAEADMALSKWFLCGAEGSFEKDEALALTFAEKAARKGLGSAEFAMGYYAEVGVGGLKDIVLARKWYAKAVSHGNPDAPDRLRALSQPAPQALSRTEHDAITDAKLVRTRTQARLSAQKDGRHAATKGRHGEEDAGKVMERMKAEAVGAAGAPTDPHALGSTHGGYDHAQAHEPPQPPQPSRTLPTRPQQFQVSPSQTRYSLTDSPAPDTTGSSLPTSPAPSSQGQGRAPGRPPGRRHESFESVHQINGGIAAAGPGSGSPQPSFISGAPTGAPAAGPDAAGTMSPPPHSMTPPALPAARPVGGAATFQEMGFRPGKAEDKECVIM